MEMCEHKDLYHEDYTGLVKCCYVYGCECNGSHIYNKLLDDETDSEESDYDDDFEDDDEGEKYEE